MSFGPSAALHPSHTAGVGPARLRPRVAWVLRTTLLTTMHIHSIHQACLQSPSFVVDWVCRDWAAISSIVLRTFRFAPSLPHLRCGPRPLTAAGGLGPQDNTAYGPCISTHAHSSLPCSFCRRSSTETFPLCSLPLRCICGLTLTDWRTIRNGRPAP